MYSSPSEILKKTLVLKWIVLQNLKTIENFKKLQNDTKVSVKDIIFSKVADLRPSSSRAVACKFT